MAGFLFHSGRLVAVACELENVFGVEAADSLILYLWLTEVTVRVWQSPGVRQADAMTRL